MREDEVAAAYDELSGQYTELFGSVEKLHPEDRRLVTNWRDATTGTLLDAGCGPGHWTHLLAAARRHVVGLDLSGEFLRSARKRFPALPLVRASVGHLPIAPGSLGGILAWYSLIHLDPAALPSVLRGFASALAPSGGLLLGLFDGEARTSFEHKVARAHFWSPAVIGELLAEAGLDVTHVERRSDAGARPHFAMTASRTS